jgi:hypothetical protein
MMGKASRRKKSSDIQVEETNLNDYKVIDRAGEQWLLLRISTGRYYIHPADIADIKEVLGWQDIIGDNFGGFIIGVYS